MCGYLHNSLACSVRWGWLGGHRPLYFLLSFSVFCQAVLSASGWNWRQTSLAWIALRSLRCCVHFFCFWPRGILKQYQHWLLIAMGYMNANWTCSAVITRKCKNSSPSGRVSVCYHFFSASNPISLYLMPILLPIHRWVRIGRVKRRQCKNCLWNLSVRNVIIWSSMK